MSDWQDDDEVTTNFRTIKMAAKENFDVGIQAERMRIVKMLDEFTFGGLVVVPLEQLLNEILKVDGNA
jgi:hypothetical protein